MASEPTRERPAASRQRIDRLMAVTDRPVLRWPFYKRAALLQRRRNRTLWPEHGYCDCGECIGIPPRVKS